MSKIQVVYWSQTGNTQAMAEAVARGIEAAGKEAELVEVGAASLDDLKNASAFAMGCPAMGDEVLEEDEFQPLYDACKGKLAGKKVALFGSYGWGDGEWMRNWEEDAKGAGIALACDSVICNDAPDDEATAALKDLGAAIA